MFKSGMDEEVWSDSQNTEANIIKECKKEKYKHKFSGLYRI